VKTDETVIKTKIDINFGLLKFEKAVNEYITSELMEPQNGLSLPPYKESNVRIKVGIISKITLVASWFIMFLITIMFITQKINIYSTTSLIILYYFIFFSLIIMCVGVGVYDVIYLNYANRALRIFMWIFYTLSIGSSFPGMTTINTRVENNGFPFVVIGFFFMCLAIIFTFITLKSKAKMKQTTQKVSKYISHHDILN
jgi:hypothetical protein